VLRPEITAPISLSFPTYLKPPQRPRVSLPYSPSPPLLLTSHDTSRGAHWWPQLLVGASPSPPLFLRPCRRTREQVLPIPCPFLFPLSCASSEDRGTNFHAGKHRARPCLSITDAAPVSSRLPALLQEAREFADDAIALASVFRTPYTSLLTTRTTGAPSLINPEPPPARSTYSGEIWEP
jgi:hypothetical protein